MGTARRQYPDEFKREALELLVSSGQPLSQIAGSWGFLLSGCGRGATEAAGAKRDRRAPNTQAAIPPAAWIWLPRMLACGAKRALRMEREILKKTLRIFSEPPK